MKRLEDKHPIVRKIEAEIERTLADYGYELVHITYGGHGGNRVLTVYMDKPGGVTADDCQHMAGHLSVLLDVLDPIPDTYNLIVSSPGVERPLMRKSDFQRFAGKPAAVTFYCEGVKHTRQGALLGLDGEHVLLETAQELLHIRLDDIESAHLLYDFDGDC